MNNNNQSRIIMVAVVAAVMMTVPAMAQFSSTSNAVQTAQTGYQPYQSTVYEPFSNKTPTSSFQGADASMETESSSRRNIRTLGGVTEDDEERSEQSPIGGALLPLALIAAAYGVAKRKKE